MFNRPLIPMLFAFAGGILASHKTLSSEQTLIWPVLVSIILSLLAMLVLSRRIQFFCLLLTFFLTGILFDLEKQRPSIVEDWAEKRESAIIEGTVLEPIKVYKGLARIRLRAHRFWIQGKRHLTDENLIVSIYNHTPDLSPGEKIRFPARLRPFRNFNNPGRYDYESAMKFKGLRGAASISDGRRIVPMGPGHLPFPRAVIERVQRPIRQHFRKTLDNRDQALFRALILGERQDIGPALREPFNQTGLGHILAVSGLHIGLVAWVVYALSKWILSRFYTLILRTDIRKVAAFITCFPVIGYTVLAGLQVSSQRAMIMALAFLGSLILGREKEVWSTLALAAFLILAADPHAIYGISFQLSFCAVIGILWLTPALFSKLQPKHDKGAPHEKSLLNRLTLYFLGLVVVSFAAMVFLIPIIAFYFHRISLVTVPANLTVVPLLGLWVIPSGLLSALILPFTSALSGLVLQLGAGGLRFMMDIINFWSHVPGSYMWVVTPTLIETGLFYGFVLLLLYYKRWPWAKMGLVCLLCLSLADVGYFIVRARYTTCLRVTYLDVGQANAALLEFPGGKRMLIDGGGFPRDQFDVGKMVVAPFLWQKKIRKVHYLVLSHPQADHMNGLRFIANNFNPQEFWYNGDRVEKPAFKELMAILEKRKIKKVLPSDLIGGREINGVFVEVLHPQREGHDFRGYHQGHKLNNNSLVVRVSYNGKSFLFPGDIEREGEAILISNVGPSLKSDILLSPHHGSRTAGSDLFLQLVRPSLCVISSGEGNFFGFPHKQTLKRLQSVHCRILRIDQCGAVECTVGKESFTVKTFLRK